MNEALTRAVIAPGIALLILATGCGKRLPPETDRDTAREAMTAALDAWKDGQPPDALRDRKPPVDFRDTSWEGGSRLTRYLVKAEERSGLSVQFTVQLVLQKDGTTRERTVIYTVDAGKSVVIRPMF